MALDPLSGRTGRSQPEHPQHRAIWDGLNQDAYLIYPCWTHTYGSCVMAPRQTRRAAGWGARHFQTLRRDRRSAWPQISVLVAKLCAGVADHEGVAAAGRALVPITAVLIVENWPPEHFQAVGGITDAESSFGGAHRGAYRILRCRREAPVSVPALAAGDEPRWLADPAPVPHLRPVGGYPFEGLRF